MTTEQPPTAPSCRCGNFRLLALGAATSEIGDWLYKVALLVFVYNATDSPAWVGAATVGRLIPYELLAPLGGLQAGTLSVSFVRRSGNAPEFLRMLGTGDGFGEIGLLEGIPRTATVRTTSACRMLRISSDTFRSALTAHPGAYGSLRASAALRLSRTAPAPEPPAGPAR